MPLTVVVGGQYGSEGKGKMASRLAANAAAPVGVRCGGPNAGHTADAIGRRLLLRQLPSAAVRDDAKLYLAAGMQLDLDVLRGEIDAVGAGPDRLTIDPQASVITKEQRAAEQAAGLDRIASTLTGTGANLAAKAMRDPNLLLAVDVPELAAYVRPVAVAVNEHVDAGHDVVVEATQGFGLSVHHGSFPHVTARDTTAAAALSEVGLSPLLVDEIVLVLRTFPIRVGGPSGPLPGELDWEQVARRAGYPVALAEYTTVTGRERRVGRFDWALAQTAVRVNRPTALAVHGLDYLDHADLDRRSWDELSPRSRAFVDELEARLGVPARWLFTGPDGEQLINRGPEHQLRAASAGRAGGVR